SAQNSSLWLAYQPGMSVGKTTDALYRLIARRDCWFARVRTAGIGPNTLIRLYRAGGSILLAPGLAQQ
ncbi:MAG: hypothetical protein KJ734_07005, partial [Chloroflexi bacterium]|nr:hypothetical protein [Chloroflexota bacterium]